MMNKKLAAALVVPAVLFCAGVAKAADHSDCECQAKTEVTATLADICELTLNGGNVAAIITPTTGILDAALTPSFKLISNEEHTLTLTGTVDTTSGAHNALFEEAGVQYLVLGNTSGLNKPTSAAIINAGSAAPVAASNDNAIAYPIVSVNASGATTGALSFAVDEYTIDTNGGTTIVTLTTGTNPRANTYDFGLDKSGQYKAELILSAAGI